MQRPATTVNRARGLLSTCRSLRGPRSAGVQERACTLHHLASQKYIAVGWDGIWVRLWARAGIVSLITAQYSLISNRARADADADVVALTSFSDRRTESRKV